MYDDLYLTTRHDMKYPLKSRSAWREKLQEHRTPRIVAIPRRMRAKLGTGRMVIPMPMDVDALIRRIPRGKLLTPSGICHLLARKYRVSAACPKTTGIFVRIVAEAAEEDRRQGRKRVAPYWRVVREDGTLNDRLPGGMIEQSMRLLGEGHTLEIGKHRGRPRIKDFDLRLSHL